MSERSNKEHSEKVKQIRKNHKKFKTFYELEKQGQQMVNDDGEFQKYENSALTNYLFQKYLVLRTLKLVVSVSLIFVGYFAYRFEFDQTIDKNDCIIYYIFVSILTFLLLILNIIENYILYQRNNAKIILKEVAVESPILQILKLLITFIHPNMLFFRQKWGEEITYNGSEVLFYFSRNFNEYLYIIQLTLLIGQIFQTLMVSTLWNNDSSDRVVRMVGFRLSNLFILKCLMRDAQKTTVFIILITTMFYYMIILNVVEAPLYYLDDIDGGYKLFIYPSISLWNTMITLFTIGYGDISVVTYLGRFFVSILTIVAGIILSFVTVAMTIDFDFEDQDRRAFALVNSVELKEEVKKASAELIVAFFRLIMAKKNCHWGKILVYQIDFDLKKRKFNEKNTEYKNNRPFDPYQPIFKALVDLELKIEDAENRYIIQKKIVE